jgi:hypothetical protein
MAETDPAGSRWRVTGVGRDPDARQLDHRSASAHARAAHRWVELESPGSGFGVERWGDEHGDDVVAEITVWADDAFAAQNLAKAIFDRALRLRRSPR